MKVIMNKNIAFLFPGQGAQYVGMGKDFFENFTIAKEIYEEANDLLHYDLSKIIFEGPDTLLKKTVYSQVAIFVTSIACLNVLNHEFQGITPKVCAGLSLGEYTALVASNKISFEDALILVQKRAQFMNDSCSKTSGTMAAIIGLDANIIEETIAKLNPPHLVWTANYNTIDQTVISGSIDGVNTASNVLQEIGAKKVIPLKVHGAFHSGLMMDSQLLLKPEIENTIFKTSEVDIVMNVCGNFVRSVEDIKKYLILQVTNSVRWKQSIESIEKNGVDIYLEIGPSRTLTMMNLKNKVKGMSLNLDKISDLEKIAQGHII
jgi:[acyl-carrier-protein] S-malonyltransferase